MDERARLILTRKKELSCKVIEAEEEADDLIHVPDSAYSGVPKGTLNVQVSCEYMSALNRHKPRIGLTDETLSRSKKK